MKTAALLFLILQFYSVCSDGISIDLSRYHPRGVDRVFENYYSVNEDTTQIDVEHINDDVGFFVIQVHTFIENVTLSNSTTFAAHSYVTGTNIGLVWGSGESNATFYLLRNIKYLVDVRVFLVVAVYSEFDPVPGGCNLTFDTIIAPYQITTYNDEYITVRSQPPSAYGVSCDTSRIEVDMYHLYLPEYNHKNKTYFDAIQKMLTVESILKYGTKVPEIEGYFKFRRLYSLYRGTGEVFGIIATFNNRSTAYVPAVSYGCDLLDWDMSCIGPVTAFWKLVCALLLIFGLFVCCAGHRYFKLTLYIIGFTFGVFITYVSISLEQNFTMNERAITSFVIGFLYGIFWTFIWWRFGIPLLSVNLAFILAGCLVASIIFYGGVADLQILSNDVNFWVIFFTIVVGCLILFTPCTRMGHIIACSFVGSYACITALNHYVGGNLQYIIINTYRRVTVRHFNYAVINPPFQMLDGSKNHKSIVYPVEKVVHFWVTVIISPRQTKQSSAMGLFQQDAVNSLIWVLLFLFGVFVQVRDQHGKPPFPPNRSGVILATRTTERTPLMSHPETVAPPEYV